ncbi:MAG TPA: gluconokinase, GntK/IdnK-type [Nitrospira sp.]|nr:gluconokinase, GntK/IdnK-type [Nitrospira sp.]
MVIVFMGAAGAGKTTVGRHLSEALQWKFVEGDTLHSSGNIAKMASGTPLTDEDRRPWLQALRKLITASVDANADLVLAASLLIRAYRTTVFAGYERQVKLVYLRASAALLRERLTTRTDHFAGAALLDSQLALLDEPADALVMDASEAPDRLVQAIRSALKV